MCAFSLISLFSRTGPVRTFGIDEYLALTDISEVTLSPDGVLLAYTITTNDLEKDEQRSAVWMTPTIGGEATRMSSDVSDASSPKWSPDGKYLAILSDRKNETDQVWLLDRRGGDAQQLTRLPQGVESFDWSPDSSQLLLVVEDAKPADFDKEERPNPRPWVIDRLQFKEDHVGYLGRYRSHIHVVELLSGDVRQLTHGDFDDTEAAWSPDGTKIVFVSDRGENPDRSNSSDLWLIGTSEEKRDPGRLTNGNTVDEGPAWSPDGRSIVYTSTDPGVLPVYAIPKLTTIEIETRQPRSFDSLVEIQAITPRFSVNGNRIFAITEYRGEQNLLALNIANGSTTKLIYGEDTVDEYTIGKDGEVYALISRPQLPGELFVLSRGALQQLTSVNTKLMDGIKTGSLQKFSHGSFDDTEMETFVTFPPDYVKGRKYPALLMLHGGPQSQYDYRFDFEAQLFAAKGYVVVMPNPRGSWGYGQAFSTAIHQDWGGVDYRDVMAAIDFAIERGWVDAERMGVFGWSYGGMLTSHVITKTNRFKAAISGASATLYMANYGHDELQQWWEEELGLPWLEENREKWNRMSPFFQLDKVKTPTLVVGGEKDWTTPIHNSEQLYIALKRQGVPTELIVYPDQGHHFSVPSYEKDLFERYLSWFNKWL